MIRSPRWARSGPSATVLAWLATLGLGAVPAVAQEEPVPRPIPAAVRPPPEYERALDRGWRSSDGSPGAGYWQQGTTYDLEGKLDPETAELEGTARIVYANHAPATVPTVWLHLEQNFHKAGSPRDEEAPITDGIVLTRVVADGVELEEGTISEAPSYEINGTLMQLRPPAPLQEGDTLRLELSWHFTIPEQGIGQRMGESDHEVYLVAYWFPKMAVLDDVRLWDAQPFLGSGEFYDDFADYTAAITVPENWTVAATGTLDNPEDVLSVVALTRLEAAAVSDTLVMIAGQAERDAGTVTARTDDGWLTYRFSAQNVRDFAWTASNVQRWDATSAVVPDRDGDGEDDRVLIQAFWRPERAPLWSQEWLYAKQSIEHHSRYTGLSYPWPHMTSVEGDGIIGGGMEFPMMTLMGTYEGQEDQVLFNTTSHELGHMWIPMIVGTNEKRYAWMDEGSTDFLELESRMEIWPGVDHFRVEARNYLRAAANGQEQPLMRHADYYEPGPGYVVASYRKPPVLLSALREILGRETFEEAYRAFISEWAFKHPTPWDFFDTFERFAGRDLDWFWTSFYYETWTVDHAVGRVDRHQGGGGTVVIEDRGQAPFPVQVRIRTASGGDIRYDIPVDHWLAGHDTYEIEVAPDAGTITRVEIDPSGRNLDVDRSNNIWPRG